MTKPDTSVEAVERLASAVIAGSLFPDAGHLLRQLRKELTEAQTAAIRVALEAAAEVALDYRFGTGAIQKTADYIATGIRSLAVDDILKRLEK